MEPLPKHVTAGKIERTIEVTGRRGRRCKQLLDDLRETRESWKLEQEAKDLGLDRIRNELMDGSINQLHCLFVCQHTETEMTLETEGQSTYRVSTTAALNIQIVYTATTQTDFMRIVATK